MFEQSKDGSNRIRITCAQPATDHVNRLLFGKFTEHLGRNIYNGMWAQALQNTSFADWSFFRHVWRQKKEGQGGDFPLAGWRGANGETPDADQCG